MFHQTYTVQLNAYLSFFHSCLIIFPTEIFLLFHFFFLFILNTCNNSFIIILRIINLKQIMVFKNCAIHFPYDIILVKTRFIYDICLGFVCFSLDALKSICIIFLKLQFTFPIISIEYQFIF